MFQSCRAFYYTCSYIYWTHNRKGKVVPARAMKARIEGAKVQLCSFYTSVLDGCEWLDTNPGRLSPAVNEHEDGWASETIRRCGEEKSLLHLPEIELRLVQSVA